MSRSRPGVRLGVLVVLLAAASGGVDAFTFLEYQVFAANQTGNLVIVALSLIDAGFPDAVSMSTTALIGFVAGVTVALLVRARLRRPDGTRALLLWLQAVVMLVAAGAFVADVPPLPLVAVIALTQGIQGEALTRVLDLGVRTVVVTGAIIDVFRLLAEHKGATAALAAAAPVGYAMGAVTAALAYRWEHVAAIVIAALLVAAAAFLVARLPRRPGLLA